MGRPVLFLRNIAIGLTVMGQAAQSLGISAVALLMHCGQHVIFRDPSLAGLRSQAIATDFPRVLQRVKPLAIQPFILSVEAAEYYPERPVVTGQPCSHGVDRDVARGRFGVSVHAG
jgi:hypothetical protein